MLGHGRPPGWQGNGRAFPARPFLVRRRGDANRDSRQRVRRAKGGVRTFRRASSRPPPRACEVNPGIDGFPAVGRFVMRAPANVAGGEDRASGGGRRVARVGRAPEAVAGAVRRFARVRSPGTGPRGVDGEGEPATTAGSRGQLRPSAVARTPRPETNVDPMAEAVRHQGAARERSGRVRACPCPSPARQLVALVDRMHADDADEPPPKQSAPFLATVRRRGRRASPSPTSSPLTIRRANGGGPTSPNARRAYWTGAMTYLAPG